MQASNMTPEDYLKLEYSFLVIADEEDGGYVIEYPDLPGCVTQVELPAMAEEARRLWVETALESGMPVPLPTYPEA